MSDMLSYLYLLVGGSLLIAGIEFSIHIIAGVGAYLILWAFYIKLEEILEHLKKGLENEAR